jgi:hypothetical protein
MDIQDIKGVQGTKPHDLYLFKQIKKMGDAGNRTEIANIQSVIAREELNNEPIFMGCKQFIADQMAQGAARTCDQTLGSGRTCHPHYATNSYSWCPPSATLPHIANWRICPVHSEPLLFQCFPYQGNQWNSHHCVKEHH